MTPTELLAVHPAVDLRAADLDGRSVDLRVRLLQRRPNRRLVQPVRVAETGAAGGSGVPGTTRGGAETGTAGGGGVSGTAGGKWSARYGRGRGGRDSGVPETGATVK